MASDTDRPKPLSLAIIGGGISGLTLAIPLLQHDIPITIYESAPRFGEIGAGVSFGPNAARAMHLIHPKINDAFQKCKTVNVSENRRLNFFTFRVGDSRKADKEGYVRPGEKVGDALFDAKFPRDWGAGGVYRAHFLDELVKEVPNNIAKFGKKLISISDAEDGSGDKVCHFEDGTTAQHTAVIGCDGIKSVTREVVLGKDDPATKAVFSGKYAYRGLIPMTKAIELLGEEEAQNAQNYLGHHGHLLTFPIEKGKTMNVVAFSSRETWEDSKWVVTTTKEEMRADFDGWGPKVQSIINEMSKPDIWALFYHLPAKTYYKDRVCLLGDAAHATTPHNGGGAGMCIEDALVLSNLLKEVQSVEDLERAFAAYDQVRRPRSQKNVTSSKETAQLYELELLDGDLDKIGENFSTRWNWLWDHDHLAEIERAREIYNGTKARF
jgi:salicylate hydroxylase